MWGREEAGSKIGVHRKTNEGERETAGGGGIVRLPYSSSLVFETLMRRECLGASLLLLLFGVLSLLVGPSIRLSWSVRCGALDTEREGVPFAVVVPVGGREDGSVEGGAEGMGARSSPDGREGGRKGWCPAPIAPPLVSGRLAIMHG